MRRARLALVGLAVMAAGCAPNFQIKKFTTNEALYSASLREFQRHKWDNAVAGFEKLTTSLPPRDTLLTRSYWYLSVAHQRKEEWLLAAQSFEHLSEGAPEDSLADDAALEAARSYRKLWRKPALDAQYGETAIAAYRTLIAAYPSSPLVAVAQKELEQVRDMQAQKALQTAQYYMRRKGWDPAILYLRDLRTQYPETPTARVAGLRLLEAYGKLKYREEAAETCAALREQYPGDAEVRKACPAPAAAPAATTP